MDPISTEETQAPKRGRKALVMALLLVPVIVAASLMAFVKVRGTLARYPFLQGSKLVTDRQIDPVSGWSSASVPTPKIMRISVYNIARKVAQVLPSARSQLVADGWAEMKTGLTFETYFTRSSGTSTASVGPFGPDTTLILMSGRAEMLPKGAPRLGMDPSRIAQGSSVVVIMEDYKPNWLQATYDRITNAKPDKESDINMTIVPGPEMAEQMRPQPSARKP